MSGSAERVTGGWPASELVSGLQRIREAAMLSQRELAERSGTSERTIRDIEAGRIRRPYPSTLRLIGAALCAASAEASGGPGSRSRRAEVEQLPLGASGFSGRAAVVRRIEERLTRGGREPGSPRIVVVSGAGGIGKSALALRVAHGMGDVYHGRRLWADLGARSGPVRPEPLEVLGRFVHALGVPAAEVPDGVAARSALFRSLVAGGGYLIVLDDAVSDAQVRPLLPGCASCGVLVTSRAAVLRTEGAHREVLDVLTPAEASELVATATGLRPDDRLVPRVVDLCGGFPLALRIAAARLAAGEGSDFVRALAVERGRMDSLRLGDLDVRSAFACTYDALPAVHRLLFRCLGVLDAPDAPEWVATALLEDSGHDGPVVLADLAAAHLVEQSRAGAGAVRYGMHDLLRVYARDRAAVEDAGAASDAALGRVLAGWLTLADAGDRVLCAARMPLPVRAPRWSEGVPGVDRPVDVHGALAWFDSEIGGLVGAIGHACATGRSATAFELVSMLWTYAETRCLWDLWERIHDLALRCAQRAGDLVAVGYLQCSLGHLDVHRGAPEDALVWYRDAATVMRRRGDEVGEIHVLQGMSSALRALGRVDESLVCADRLGELAELTGNEFAVGLACFEKAGCHVALRQLDAAAWSYRAAAVAFAAAGDRRCRAAALRELGTVRFTAGALEEARELLVDAAVEAAELGHRRDQARCAVELSRVLAAANRRDEAATMARLALTISVELGDSRLQTASAAEIARIAAAG